MKKLIALIIALPLIIFAGPVEEIQKAGFTGGLVVQIGSDDLSLKDLGERFHVRLLLPDAKAVEKAQQAIDRAGLQGRFTVSEYPGGDLPFAERVVNGLIVSSVECRVEKTEIERVLMPRGLFFNHQSAISNPQFVAPLPDTIDDWTHNLYDASGNPVSKDKEVGPPKSFRWYAPPFHLRSHDWGASFQGLVTGNGRIFHMLDEGAFFYEHGELPERWSLVARDAFNGALLWKRPLEGYGHSVFEYTGHQKIWRAPLAINRRVVVQGDRLYTSLDYRGSTLDVLDAKTGQTLHAVDIGGSPDEIIADGDLVVCRVREEIPMPDAVNIGDWRFQKKLMDEKGLTKQEAGDEMNKMKMDYARSQTTERVVAVDAKDGRVLWSHSAPVVAHTALAMADGKVVFHNYDDIVCLDAKTGKPVWTYAHAVKKPGLFRVHLMLGVLILYEGNVFWSGETTGGAVCLNLADGTQIWESNRSLGAPAFNTPTANRIIDGVAYNDVLNAISMEDGSPVRDRPDIGDMLKRGHHIRCFPGKATERYIITPHRGAEFVDLQGDNHMVNDWIRGACSLGNMPANGLFYVSPDPCVCYAGAKINGFQALAPEAPTGLEKASPISDDARWRQGEAYVKGVQSSGFSVQKDSWASYRAGARRTGRAGAPLSPSLKPTWTVRLAEPVEKQYSPVGDLTQATLADGQAFIVRKDTYELICLNLTDGKTVWTQSFPAALNGPPTALAGKSEIRNSKSEIYVYAGCADGSVYCLRASDGALVWSRRIAPLDRLTFHDDTLANIWPVNTSVIFHHGLIYAVAGRNSYLDQGVHLVALDPATGAVKHHLQIDGPWPTEEQLFGGVTPEPWKERQKGKPIDPELMATVTTQYATGYSIHGADADLLVTDGKDLYMTQNKFTPELERVDLTRAGEIGLIPMGGDHVMAQNGFLDNTMYHRHFWLYDNQWMGKSGGSGFAAKAGTMLAVGKDNVYAAKHYKHGWYPSHEPGSGNLLVCDAKSTENKRGDYLTNEKARELGVYRNTSDFVRTAKQKWEVDLPVIVRAMLAAPSRDGGELVFTAGVMEGESREDWARAGELAGPAKLYVHDGATGEQLAEYDLPACPVFDGLSAAEGQLIVPMLNGEVVCFAGE